MKWQKLLPAYPLTSEERVIVLESYPGPERQAVLDTWLKNVAGSVQSPGFHRLVDCDFAEGGSWAGVAPLLGALVPRIRATNPLFLVEYDCELAAILPELRATIRPRHPSLVELSPYDERVQGQALGRAYRLVHGAIDLLLAFRATNPRQGAWTLVCNHFGRAGALTRLFFRELVRRAAKPLGLTLLAAVDPGQGEAMSEELSRVRRVVGVRRELAPAKAVPPAPEVKRTSARAAIALERQVEHDPDALEANLPRLVRLWEQSDEPGNALRWRVAWLDMAHHRGYYEDALVHMAPLLAAVDTLCDGDARARWRIVGKLCGSLAITGRPELAQRVMQDEIVAKVSEPSVLARAFIALSVYQSRYLPKRDIELAEQYARRASEELDRIHPPTEESVSVAISANNALALIRHHQKRYDEALEICRASRALLDAHFGPQRHRLRRAGIHRHAGDVLLAMGAYEEALANYSAVVAIDPNSPEDHQLLGNACVKAGLLAEAEKSYRKALALSPPYAEAFVNLGQCYRAMGQAEDAARMYSAALDLEPENTLALVGRAQAYDSLGEAAKACADYDAVLALSPDDALVLANRAILHYEAGRLERSIRDLDRAIAVSAGTAGLYQNRAAVLLDLDRKAEALSDLAQYLLLRPDAEDRAEVRERMSQLRHRVAARAS